MKQEPVRFDMKEKPRRQKPYLLPLAWALSLPDVLLHRTQITKTRMEGVKPPYVLLCNHNAFMDFKVATMAIFPHRANYIVAIDGFIGREGLLRDVGCICKRKFTSDLTLIRQLHEVVKNGDIVLMHQLYDATAAATEALVPALVGQGFQLVTVSEMAAAKGVQLVPNKVYYSF